MDAQSGLILLYAMKNKQQKKNLTKEALLTRYLILLSCLVVVCIGVTVWALFFRGATAPVITPDYAPPYDDENAEKIPGDFGEKLEASEGGGAISIQYGETVTIDLSDDMAYLTYSNPGKSTKNMVVQIEIKGQIVAQSGLVRPGYQLKKIELLPDAKDMLREGVYENAKLRFLSYDPVTAEKSMVDTEGAVQVTVRK